MVKKGTNSTSLRSRKVPSHRDLVKSVSKQLKYYFEIKRQEDGFDLSGPECPRADYPALKSRPMLLYEGLHDRSVKHFYSDYDVKQRITHMRTYDASTAEAKKTEKLMKKTMDKVSYVPAPLIDFMDRVYHDKPPWMGVGMNGGNTKYTKNSEKYVSGTLGEWSVKPKKSRCKGYGNPEPTLQTAFAEPAYAKPRVRRSCPSGWIDNRECGRLITGASRILASSEYKELASRPHSSKPASYKSTESSVVRARSTSPRSAEPTNVTTHKVTRKSRLTSRPQSGHNSLNRPSTTYHDTMEDIVREHEEKETSKNLKKGKIYYDIDGRRKPVPHKVQNDEGYLEREERGSPSPLSSGSEDKVPDWLKTQTRRQDVNEKKMPYNNSVRSVELSEPNTARPEDVSKREGVRLRPKSAKRTKSKTHRGEEDRDSHVTLSVGSYEEVKLDDSDSGEEAYYEDRGCQTGWELFVQYDQTENVLYDGEAEATRYKVIVRTGSTVGASTGAPVYLILYGSRGRSPDLPLVNCENHKIMFQQNASDIFYVTCSYVGTLSRVDIGHNSDSEAWYLDSVTVHDPTKEEAYEFLCAKWLSVKADDKKTRRKLEITATRKIEAEGAVSDNDEEEAEVSKVVTEPVIPKPASKASTASSTVSTSHLRNDSNTVPSEPRGSAGPPSDTASTASLDTKAKITVGFQQPFVTSHAEGRSRKSPEVPEDFESDVTMHTDKKSVSSGRSGSTVSDSENQTARFEERSVLSDFTELRQQQEAERMDAFKAGQKAERERQRLEEEKKQAEQAEAKDKMDIFRGPTIHYAAKHGNLNRIKELLDHNNEMKNSIDAHGNTPLHYATQKGHKETVQLLAATGADVDIRDQVGYEAAHVAALNGHVNCLMILVAMGASINSKTDDCKLPIHLAAMSGNLETCKWLVANRSHLDEEDDFGRTPVDMAENNGHDNVAMFLRTCINDLKERRSSLESLLLGKDDWKDDKPETPITYHKNQDSSDDEQTISVADLRREARAKEEKEVKQKAYAEMQQQLADSEMTYLDRIRYEVDNS